MFIYLKANLFNDLFYVLKEILNLAICCYNILVMEFLGCYKWTYHFVAIGMPSHIYYYKYDTIFEIKRRRSLSVWQLEE
jgi:hypothetical protein